MAIKPSKESIEQAKELKNMSSVEKLNLVREMADDSYRERVPKATKDNLTDIGMAINTYDPIYSQFMQLMGRIAFTIVRNLNFENPLAKFKRGLLEYGESVQEYFVNLAEPHQYDELEDLDDWHMLKTEKPEIDASYYHVNYEIYYKQTIIRREVKRAFLSQSGVSDLLDRIINTMYVAYAMDEYLIMMYLLAKGYINKTIPTFYADSTNIPVFMGATRGVSGAMTLPSTRYNYAGVENSTEISREVVLINPWFEGQLDAESLAYAFNSGKADFLQKRVVINGFNEINYTRLKKLLSTKKGQISTTAAAVFTDEELTQLAKIKCFIVDEEWFSVWDEDLELTDFYNGEKKGWSYWLHCAKIVGSSPYMPAVCLTDDDTFPPVNPNDGEVLPPLETGLVFNPAVVNMTYNGSQETSPTVDVSIKLDTGETIPATNVTANVPDDAPISATVTDNKIKILSDNNVDWIGSITVTSMGYTARLPINFSKQ